MAYTTEEDVKQVITPVAGQGRGGWSLADVDVAHHIRDAKAEIDTRLAARYATPFPDWDDDPATPEIIREICQDIAAYLSALQASGGAGIPAEHAVYRRYVRKQQMLLDLQNGVIELPGSDDDQAGTFDLINSDRSRFRVIL